MSDHRERLELALEAIVGAADPHAELDSACTANPDLAARLRRAFDELRASGLLDEPNTTSAAPDRIGGYQIRDVLGRGGMGIVYRAYDPELDRDIALKVLRPELLHFEDSRERFRREIQSTSRLRHPGIVSVFSANETGGEVPFFTMELVDGVSLATTITALRGQPIGSRRGSDLLGVARAPQPGSSTDTVRLSESWMLACVQVARMVAEALQHAHDQGVFHRDVKPSNILIDRHGRARLLDFGLARLESSQQLTKSTSMLGSLPYMPPEQVRGELTGHGAQQDVYSLGVTLCELLTLHQPFLADNAEETRRRVAAGEMTPLRRIDTGISRELEIVCRKAIDLDPQRRYASAREFANDLDNILERRPIAARPAGVLLRSWRFAQRNSTLSVAVVLGVMVMGASVFAAVTSWRAKQVERTTLERLVDSNLAFAAGFARGMRKLSGNSEIRLGLMRAAADQLIRLEDELELDTPRLCAVTGVHLRLANALGNMSMANLGERDAARERYRHAIALTERIAPNAPVDAASLHAHALLGLTSIARFDADDERARELLQQAVAVLEPHLADVPETRARKAVVKTYLNARTELAAIAGSAGDHAAAKAGFEAVAAHHRRHLEQDPDDEQLQLAVARSAANVAKASMMLGDYESAFADYAPLIEFVDRDHARSPDDPTKLFARLHHAIHWPDVLIRSGRIEQAIARCETDLGLCEQLLDADPNNQSAQDFRLTLTYDLGWAYQNRATLAIDDGATARDSAVRSDLETARSWLQRAQQLVTDLASAGQLGRHQSTGHIALRLEAIDAALEGN